MKWLLQSLVTSVVLACGVSAAAVAAQDSVHDVRVEDGAHCWRCSTIWSDEHWGEHEEHKEEGYFMLPACKVCSYHGAYKTIHMDGVPAVHGGWDGAPCSCLSCIEKDDPDDWKEIFDGESLEGWDGNPEFWSVEDGALTGQTTKEKPTQGNTFLIWRGGEPADFELKLQFRISSHNSGVQYRSFETKDKWVVGGYQADIDFGNSWSGTNYGERFGGILAKRGEKAVRAEDGKRTVEKLGDPAELAKKIKPGEWNDYHIIAKGRHMVQKINGVVMSEFTDNAKSFRPKGLLALQLHAGPPMKVQFRGFRLRVLSPKPGDGLDQPGTRGSEVRRPWPQTPPGIDGEEVAISRGQ